MLRIELLNYCNFNCYFCGAGTKKIPKQILTIDIIKTWIPDIQKLGISTIVLTPSRGEIFLHPQIYDILSYLTSLNFKITFFTNVSAININKLFNSNINLDLITFGISHYGFEGEEEFKRQTRSKYYKRTENIISILKEKCNCVFSPRTKNYEYEYDGYKRTIYTPIEGVCANFFEPRILTNGDFALCSCSGEPDEIDLMIVGNVFKTSLYNLYTSPIRYEIYNQFKTCIPEMCKGCTAFSKMNYNLKTLKQIQLMKKENDKNN